MSAHVRRWPKAISDLRPYYEVSLAKGFEAGRDYCGVTAMAAITGEWCPAVTEAVQRLRGNRKPVVNMGNHELANVLGHLGYRTDLFEITCKPGTRLTLNRFWRDRGDAPASIVVLRGHYVAIDNALIVDTCTGGRTDFVPDHAYAKCGVMQYMEVRKL